MASQATKIARLELGADWLDASDAARALGVNVKQLASTVRPMLTHKSRSLAGKGARYVGYAYATGDVERVTAIKKAIGCDALQATRILFAIRRLGHLGILASIEKQLELEAPARAHRDSPLHKRKRKNVR